MNDKGSKLNCTGCDTGLPLDVGERLLVDGELVDMTGLEEIMEEVRKMKLAQRKQVADELIQRVKGRNQVPPGREVAFRNALMDEYDRRYLGIM
ncbi:MAG: hypothetical protein MIO90_00205 [Methanomassiliicoccales archaeon]|nr:hypothetical protein [Methanomassiliicoccales archaeon]